MFLNSNSKKITKAREAVYDTIRNNNIKPTDDEGILLRYKLDKNDILKIQKNVKEIIFKSLTVFYKKKFKKVDNFLKVYEKEILKLPIITPSGSFQPKKEIIKEYNNLHNTMVKLLSKLELLKHISKAAFIGLRIKKGETVKIRKEYNKRSYSTNKLHSDAWNGQTSDSVISIMVFGDIKNNCIKFYKPLNVKKNFLKKIKDFSDGKNYYKRLKYLGKSGQNELVVFDQLCLHKTQIKSLKSRISIDLNVHWKKKGKNNFFDKSSKRYNYFNLKKWSKLDYKNIKQYQETFKETVDRFKSN